MLEKLKKLNSGLEIFNADDERALPYGCKVDYDFSNEIDYIINNTQMPEEGVLYLADVDGTPREESENKFYGTMPVQMGICYGFNSKLNGLEYHIGSEIVVAITDIVLLVAHLYEVQDKSIHSDKVVGIYVEAGSAFKMYETTMHLAPCKLSDEGFKSIIILPKGTNLPLDKKTDDQMLFAVNKWLLAHPENIRSINNGALVGVEGKNIVVKY